MIDTVRINIKAGNGGSGCTSFLREKYKPRGGPNGGDGGTGGSAYLVGDTSLNTLLDLKYNSTFYVDRGGHGKGKDMTGGHGADTFIKVPLGTVVCQLAQAGEKKFLADIIDETPRLVARGGSGGWGNAHYVTSTNQEPMLSQQGQDGEYIVLFLELKLLADVGLLAKPNAGKSTLISRCTAAKPKIAAYPFTTVEPVLGVVNHRNRDFVMMEVPGLLEGAHDGVGLGDQFLRHAERARVYIHVLDGMSEDPVADYRMINEELRQFDPSMADKYQVIAVNKMDITEVRELREYLEVELREAVRQTRSSVSDSQRVSSSVMDTQFNDPDRAARVSMPSATGQPTATPMGTQPDTLHSRKAGGDAVPSSIVEADDNIFFISAVTGEGIDAMLDRVIELMDSLPKEEKKVPAEEGYIFTSATRLRPDLRPISFHMDKGVYVVESEILERLSARADMRDYRVLLQLWREMSRLGIARRLQDAGITPGDTIRIGKAEMEWF